MKLFTALLLPALTGLGLGVLVAAPASAHTPTVSASCGGVRVSGTGYDAGSANRWSVTINGTTQSGIFDTSFDQTFPVPQGGATTTWSAFVEAADGSYHGEGSGSVGPCGTPPPPPPPTDVCPGLPGDQPTGTACTPPPDVQRATPQHLGGCAVTFGGTPYGAGDLTYVEQYTDTYAFDGATNAWTLVTDTTATIANLVFTPWTTAQQVASGCAAPTPQPPALQTRERNTSLDCADAVRIVTTIVTTTPFVYDAASNTWVPGEPVVDRKTHRSPARPGECKEATNPVVVGAPETTQTVTLPTRHTPVRSAAPQARPNASTQVPSAVEAGMVALDQHPAAVSAAPVPSEEPGNLPTLALLAAGTVLGVAALRVRRG